MSGEHDHPEYGPVTHAHPELVARLTALETAEPPPVDPPPPPPPPIGRVLSGTQPGFTATVAGENFTLDGAVFTSKVDVQAPDVTFTGSGQFNHLEQHGDRLTVTAAKAGSIRVKAPLHGFVMWGADGLQMTDVAFADTHETAINFWLGPGGRTCRNFAVIRASILNNGTPNNGKGYSLLSSQRPPGDVVTGPKHGPGIIKDGQFDSGKYGWYGAEIWDTRGLQIVGNTFKGTGGFNGAENGHMSPARCDGLIVRSNTFDMTQGCWRVMEFVESNDILFTLNTVLGGGSSRGDVAPMAGGSSNRMQRATITFNRIRDIREFVNLAGSGHVVTDNRLTNITVARAGSGSATWERNGPNDGPAW